MARAACFGHHPIIGGRSHILGGRPAVLLSPSAPAPADDKIEAHFCPFLHLSRVEYEVGGLRKEGPMEGPRLLSTKRGGNSLENFEGSFTSLLRFVSLDLNSSSVLVFTDRHSPLRREVRRGLGER